MRRVYLVVEGYTEQTFVRDILSPYLSKNSIFLEARLVGKPSQKGGNIRFDRAKTDIGILLKQEQATFVSTMFDFFGIDKNWPGLKSINNPGISACEKAHIVEKETSKAIANAFPKCDPQRRFIPYIQMHEFEVLLFSNSEFLSAEIGIENSLINDILSQYNGLPEEINQDPERSPSKQLMRLNNCYRQVSMGTAICRAIGIDGIRTKCPHFHQWLNLLEKL
jgi:hypothetical protein